MDVRSILASVDDLLAKEDYLGAVKEFDLIENFRQIDVDTRERLLKRFITMPNDYMFAMAVIKEVDLDIRFLDGNTPITYAIKEGASKGIIATMGAISRNPMDVDGNHSTPLVLLLERNTDQDLIVFFIARGLESPGTINAAQLNSGDTALHIAASRGNLEAAGLISKLTGVVNTRNRAGYTPLHVALATGNLKIAKIFIDTNADLEIRGADGKSAKEMIIETGDTDLIEFMERVKMEENARKIFFEEYKKRFPQTTAEVSMSIV